MSKIDDVLELVTRTEAQSLPSMPRRFTISLPPDAIAGLRELGELIDSGSPLGLLVGEQLCNGRHVFLRDHEVGAAVVANDVIHLEGSEFFRDLLTAVRAIRQLDSHLDLRGG